MELAIHEMDSATSHMHKTKRTSRARTDKLTVVVIFLKKRIDIYLAQRVREYRTDKLTVVVIFLKKRIDIYLAQRVREYLY